MSLSPASTHPPDSLAEGFTHPPAEEIAKGNTNASIGDRISAGVDAIGNKADESKQSVAHPFSSSECGYLLFTFFYSDSKAEAYKTSAKN